MHHVRQRCFCLRLNLCAGLCLHVGQCLCQFQSQDFSEKWYLQVQLNLSVCLHVGQRLCLCQDFSEKWHLQAQLNLRVLLRFLPHCLFITHLWSV